MNADDQRIEEAAADWLYRREQGLDAQGQDAYLQWLRDDPSHGRAIARLERSWRALDALKEWRPHDSAVPNPDLLSRPPRGLATVRRRWRQVGVWTALAACLALACVLAWQGGAGWGIAAEATQRVAAKPQVIRHEPEQRQLPDGTRLTLQPGSQVEVAFSPTQRRVRLTGGEAHFEVAKNPDWPFFVETSAGLTVRAVGTAFNVRLAEAEVAVVVTEGKVRLEPAETLATGRMTIVRGTPPQVEAGTPSQSPGIALAAETVEAAEAQAPILVAGQSAKLARSEMAAAERTLQVVSLSPEEVARATDWRAVRLEFRDLPLTEVVAEFNRYNPHRICLGDTSVGKLTIGGTFRADNAAAFVRLLERLLGVRVQSSGDVTTIYAPEKPRR